MTTKKRRSILTAAVSLAVVLLAVLLAVLGYWITHSGVHMSADVRLSQENRVEIEVVNSGMSDGAGRRVVVLSVFDEEGCPVSLDGTATSPASVDLLNEKSGLPMDARTIQGHQSVYSCDIALAASNPIKILTGDYGASALREECTLIFDTSEISSGSVIVRIDAFILTRDEAASAWKQEDTATLVLGEGGGLEQVTSLTAEIPELTEPTDFDWDVTTGKALLRGMGDVTEKDLIVPTQVFLSAGEEGWYEDVLNGESFEVELAGKCFEDCEFLRSVTFQEGAVFSADYRTSYGADVSFRECTALVKVIDLPDSITNMNGTFRGCSSLQYIDALPSSVTNLTNCFNGCTALEESPEIPDTVIGLNGCFSGCTSLRTAPELPEGVSKLESCFMDCTSLVEAPELPDGLISIAGCFSGCTSLREAPAIPGTVTDMFNCFSGCTALTAAPVLPEGLSNMYSAFQGCTSLTTVPEIPDSVVTIYAAFQNCTQLQGNVTLPTSLVRDGTVGTAFFGADLLDTIYLTVCDRATLSGKLSDTAETVRTETHEREGICPYCHLVNLTTSINGLTVVFEDTPKVYYDHMVEYIENELPEALYSYCSRLTFTPELGKYDSKYREGYQGFAQWPSGRAYVEVEGGEKFEQIEKTTVHELAHTYDHAYSYDPRFSDSAAWRAIHEKEGQKLADLFYNETTYNGLALAEQWKETYAMAVAAYFTFSYPYGLQTHHRYPEALAYVEAQFSE